MKELRKVAHIKFLPLLILAFIFYKLIDNYDKVLSNLDLLISIVSPFFWALAISYFLNPLVKYFEKKFNLNRILSLISVYLIFFGILFLVLGIVTPRIFRSLKEIIIEVPEYIKGTETFINNTIDRFSLSGRNKASIYLNENLTQLIEKGVKYLDSWFNLVLTKVIGFTSSFFKFIIGIIVSIYMLKDKENIINYIKNILYALLGYDRGSNFISFGSDVNNIFSKYIIGRFIDSAIIGLLCIVLLSIIGAPYSLLIGIVVGVTNMIPYFGPFIGMGISLIIVLIASPSKTLLVAILLFLLQQFDGFYLGPKILGDKVGLSPLIIIFAITIGGGFFGILGMFLGVPVIATIRMIIDRFISRRLYGNIKNKNSNKL